MADGEFADALATLGYVVVQQDRRGTLQFARRANRFLTEWVHDDGAAALFTWEFDLGEFCASMGWQIGAGETSFQILYPRYDVRTARDGGAIAAEMERLEARLRRLDLAAPDL